MTVPSALRRLASNAAIPLAALLGFVRFVDAPIAKAADYVFVATVTEMQLGGADWAHWGGYFPVGQTFSGTLKFDEALAPSGFGPPGSTTSLFTHPTPNEWLGIQVYVDSSLGGIRADGSDPHRIERSDTDDDFHMITTGKLRQAGWPDLDIAIELQLGDIGGAVDHLILPDPLSPTIPSAVNRLLLQADSADGYACPGGGTCSAVAEIIAFYPEPDSDSDGVLDSEDNCVDVPNGPLAATNSCDAQQDADMDGFGNGCDSDINNDGGPGGFDISYIFAAFREVSTNPVFDLNCDGAVGLDDVSKAWYDLVYYTIPGPSGLVCAGDVPCP